MQLPEKRNILFRLTYKDEEYPVQTARNEYHSLMSLVSDHLGILGFGLCSGMGSCGTCMVMICSNKQPEGISTLSCAISINDELANTNIIINERYY